MTLDDVMQRLQKPPLVGTHEIVATSDGIKHLAIIVMAHDISTAEGIVREYAVHLFCNRSDVLPTEMQVVDEAITCIHCIQWRTK